MTVLGTTHVVEQILFSIVPSILTFDFFLGGLFDFLDPYWSILGVAVGLK